MTFVLILIFHELIYYYVTNYSKNVVARKIFITSVSDSQESGSGLTGLFWSTVSGDCSQAAG